MGRISAGTDSGQFSSTEINHAATATWSINGSPTGSYGSITVDGTGQWTYTLANGTDGVASVVQSLKAGESHDEVFSVQVSDSLGGVDTQLVTATVTGTNDAAVLSSASVTLSETNAPLTTGGSLTVSDIDSPESFQTQTDTSGNYGKFSIGTNGAWTYVVDSAHNEFAAGTTYTDIFTVSSADGTLTSVNVHIAGSNDLPIITSNDGGATASVNMAENTTAVTTVGATDADLPTQTLGYSILNTAGTEFGKFSISSSGALTFNSAPDYKNAQDVGGTDGDNAYVMDVQATDGNGDCTWTLQTNDPGALTVTTPSDFAGALVLDVNMYWSNSDGSTTSAYVFNNVEVYAPGSPVFALSADDNLTGSSGADTFVFAQPIGNNQIYNFDVTADKIDLIGFTGVTAFADLSISNDVNGNALVSIGSGQTVTLRGVDAADLSEANFQFDRDPLTQNTGPLTIADGAIMPFGGSIDNSGTIELGSAGNETRLEILFRGATLTGGGQVLLSDNAQNVIFGGSANTVLTNVDNRISGAGQLGAGQMILANAGLVLASGLNSLVLDTGSHTITNSGVLESTGTGGMTVVSTVENTGHLWANGGDLHLLADVTGNGSATIDGDASLTFAGAAHTSVAFHGEGAGSLVIAQAEAAGSLVGILGLESDDLLTFGYLAFGANTQLSYTANASGADGLLTVGDGAHRAEVNLLGHYSAEDFQVTDGGEAGTQVSFHGEFSGTLVGSMLADTLSDRAGADVFAYLNANEGGDHILDYNFAEGDTVDLSTLLNANFVSGTSHVADFVQLAQSDSDITVQVDPDGANNGKHFVDVAVLDHAGTPSPDLVRTWFGEADHTLTA
ncbi:VCBS domain-containing protein [Pseudomonas chlororaphis]|uniref:VCBS domain-containing protein n=1 Tax=Pseudomonas chlororaphis TaxID=587753 RepID=UPI000B2B768F|nr:VCBS domain-containing protein [Pseudomonas chlororaphis]AZD00718.1 T1SS secreted agglutinin RTX [Pseudomonas chlororaphis subsp. chlororaphis]WDG99114.1 VCBS domain-containing protein [Pseudomonas chlororaphis]WDH18121.1 VCBS domain-containing protein [Pseudomonas chlororaphis]WDH67138.1 VCBS domain-containing protein [Pseudomonas chlororaphis]SMQ05366.1 type I secretion C-terminal target domain (VC_A0849 subclass) [Pseudomonas chlororaphis]